MSLLRRSTGRGGELFPEELQSDFRPMSSHARMENVHARTVSDKAAVPQDKTPRQHCKVFLPQLSQAKAFISNSRRQQESGGDEDDGVSCANDGVDVDTDAFRQAMWAGQANILVTVRLRPHLGHDRDNEEIVKVLDHKLVVVLDAATGGSGGMDTVGNHSPVRRHTSHPIRKLRNATVSAAQRRSRERRFAFDYVFTPEDGQQTVYCHTTKFLIHGVLNGFNATVFAYGCTGAGKTYTMLGTPDQPGIMALTLEDLFQNIARVHADPLASVTYKVTVSFLEVYNENIRDLLVTPSSSTLPGGTGGNEFLDLREDPIKGPTIAGISEIEACNALEVMKLLRKGNKHRSQEATAANAVSSRSHAVLQVLVEQREKTSSPMERDESLGGGEEAMTTVVKFGKLSLVDLAGSERAAVTQNRGQRLLEGANINRSLLALGNCINALGEKGASSASFVPYRDSKLTRLLKDSLGGNCRTVMIANISLAAASLEETLNTLKYANRAKNIKTTVTRNVLNVDHHITEYVGVISSLRDEIATLKKQLVRQHDLISGGGPSPAGQQRIVPTSSAHRLGDSTRSNNSNNNNNEDENGDGEEAPSAKVTRNQLQEVRQHITRYFAERLRLREALLRINCQIETIVENAQTTSESEEVSVKEENKIEGTPRPEIDGLLAAAEKNQDEFAATASSSSVVSSGINHNGTHFSDETLESKQVALEKLEALTLRKKSVRQELTRLETRMEEFRSAILKSSSLMDHTLFKEVLMMEFRVGNLEIEKMELQLAKELKDLEIGNLKLRIDGRQPEVEPTQQQHQSGLLKLPLLSQQFSPTFSASQPPNTTTSPSANETEASQRNSPSPRSNLGFIDDPRDKFHALKASCDDNSHPNHHHVATTGKSQQYQLQHASGTSSILNNSGTSSSRKQWGLSLASTSLPYIRLKKKHTTNDLSSAIGAQPVVAASVTRTNFSSKPSSASVTAPYLRVLKHRRKSHYQNAKQAATNTNGSHKK